MLTTRLNCHIYIPSNFVTCFRSIEARRCNNSVIIISNFYFLSTSASVDCNSWFYISVNVVTWSYNITNIKAAATRAWRRIYVNSNSFVRVFVTFTLYVKVNIEFRSTLWAHFYFTGKYSVATIFIVVRNNNVFIIKVISNLNFRNIRLSCNSKFSIVILA